MQMHFAQSALHPFFFFIKIVLYIMKKIEHQDQDQDVNL